MSRDLPPDRADSSPPTPAGGCAIVAFLMLTVAYLVGHLIVAAVIA